MDNAASSENKAVNYTEFDEKIHPTEQVKEFFKTFPKNNPFLDLLGLKLEKLAAGMVTMSVKIKPEHANVHGIAHGGVATTLLDTAMGSACYSLSKGVVSLSVALEFVAAVPLESTICATARVRHNGRHTMVCEGEVFDSETGTLYLKGQSTFYVLRDYLKNPEIPHDVKIANTTKRR